jgi:hypothetical protein
MSATCVPEIEIQLEVLTAGRHFCADGARFA